jgi:DNA polymerase III subunit alpha
LEKGSDVLVTLQGALEGEDVRARIIHVEPLALAAARVHKGLRIFLRDEAPLPSIEERLRAKGEGEVSLVVMLGQAEGEVEIKLPGRFAVSASIAGALKAVPGVVAVEHV